MFFDWPGLGLMLAQIFFVCNRQKIKFKLLENIKEICWLIIDLILSTDQFTNNVIQDQISPHLLLCVLCHWFYYQPLCVALTTEVSLFTGSKWFYISHYVSVLTWYLAFTPPLIWLALGHMPPIEPYLWPGGWDTSIALSPKWLTYSARTWLRMGSCIFCKENQNHIGGKSKLNAG